KPAAGAASVSNREALYAGDFTITRNTVYHLKLMSAAKQDNPDSQARQIRYKPDDPPKIAIVMPKPQDAQAVRPDDTVPMKFMASDDFVVVKVEAMVRVDGGTEQAVNVPIAAGTSLTGDWDLHVADALAGHAGAHTISYRFRATDN